MIGGQLMAALLRETEGLDQAAFVARHPHPFLVRETMRPSGEWRALPREAGAEQPTAKIRTASVPTADASSEAVLVYSVRPADPTRAELLRAEGGAVVLGRGAGCDVVIEDISISQRHAQLVLELDEDGEPGYLVEDLGSSNGTFLDGKQLQPGKRRPIEDSMSLRLGPAVKLQFFGAAGFHLFLTFYRRVPPKGSR